MYAFRGLKEPNFGTFCNFFKVCTLDELDLQISQVADILHFRRIITRLIFQFQLFQFVFWMFQYPSYYI